VNSRDRIHCAIPSAVALFILSIQLVIRSTGINFDELVYVFWAKDGKFLVESETLVAGKPPAFYFINAIVYRCLEFIGPLCLHVFYIVILAISLGVLARSLASFRQGSGQPACRYLVLLYLLPLVLNPFILFHGTQVMMETALIPVLSFLVAACFPRPRHCAILFLSALAILIKDSALPAVGALGVVQILFFGWRSRKSLSLWCGLAGGWLINRAILFAVGAEPMRGKGFSTLRHQLFHWDEYTRQGVIDFLAHTLFYIGPITLIIATVIVMRRRNFRNPFLSLGLLSLLGVIFVRLSVEIAYPHYGSPMIWIGIVSFLSLALQPGWKAAVIILIAWAVPIATMNLPDVYRYRFWPHSAVEMTYFSGLSVVPGVALGSWILSHREIRKKPLCILVTEENTPSESATWTSRGLFHWMTEYPFFFNEREIEKFRQCPHPKAYVSRRIQPKEKGCAFECPFPNAGTISCEWQKLTAWVKTSPVWVKNEVCLP